MAIITSVGGFTADNGTFIQTSTFTRYNNNGADLRTSVWGSTIPLSMGYRKVAGSVIWGGTPYKADEHGTTYRVNDYQPPVAYVTWNVKRNFAVALGYRLDPDGTAPKVRRIWVDGKLAYANGTALPLTYDNVQQRYMPTGYYKDGIYVPAGSLLERTVDGQNYVNGDALPQLPVSSTLSFSFHDGSETQTPDPVILSDLGADAPSFRGMIYLVVKDYVVGTGSKAGNQWSQFPNGTGYDEASASQTVSGSFPLVEVELVDGIDDALVTESFRMLDDSPPMGSTVAMMLSDWSSRTAYFANTVVFGESSYVFTYDLDAMVQTGAVPIGGSYTPDGYVAAMALDRENKIIYATHVLSFTSNLLSINATTGDVISHTTATPSNGETGDIGYVLSGSSLEPLLFYVANTNVSYFIHPSKEGVIQDVAPDADATIDPPTNYWSGNHIRALPLWKFATSDQHLSDQDAAFIYTMQAATGAPGYLPAKLFIAYVGLVGGKPFIRGTQELLAGTASATSFHLLIDANGNIVVQETSLVQDARITRLTVDYKGDPDFEAAPGWRGLFPKITVGPTIVLSNSALWDQEQGVNANLDRFTFAASHALYDLNSLTTSTLSFNAGNCWDSTRALTIYPGTIPPEDPQAFTGRGLYWAQSMTGMLGGVNTLANALEAIALASGRYTLADISIDASLTTEVPGVLITKPYDLGTLFNSMGALYQFTYFNSGGKLTFRRSSNDPIYATGYVFAASAPNDGDTVTIGTVVYRFKSTMSAPFDVQLATNTSATQLDAKEKSLANLLAAVMGDATLGRDNVPFYAGTTANPKAVGKQDKSSTTNNGYTKITITSTVGGTAGNSVALATSSGGRLTVSNTHLAGGEEPPAPSVTLTVDQLCSVGEDQITEHDALVTIIPPPGASQTAAAVRYYALEQDYKLLQQSFSPDSQNGEQDIGGLVTTYDVPIVMSTSEAYARVSGTGFAQADMVVQQTFRLPQSYLMTEPNDVLSITIAPFQYIVRVDEATFNGDFSMSISATNFSARTDVPVNNSDSASNIPQTLPNGSDAYPLVIDAPLLDVAYGSLVGDVELLVGVRPFWTTFSTAIVSGAKTPFVPAELFHADVGTKWGTINGGLPTLVEPWYSTHEDSIILTLKSASSSDFQSATDYYTFVGGENCLAVGAAGRWEYIYFRDVEVLNTRVVKLTGLIRAQRGTDEAAQNHAAGDVAVLLASASPTFKAGTKHYSLAATEVSSTYEWVALGIPALRGAQSEKDVVKGHSLYPFSPCLPSAVLAGGNDIDLSWVRRDRLGTEFVTNDQVLSETSEKYDLEIMSGSTVVRTLLDLTSPAYTYTSTQQTADGFSPPLANIKFRVYQKGELGRGFPHEETVNVD